MEQCHPEVVTFTEQSVGARGGEGQGGLGTGWGPHFLRWRPQPGA